MVDLRVLSEHVVEVWFLWPLISLEPGLFCISFHISHYSRWFQYSVTTSNFLYNILILNVCIHRPLHEAAENGFTELIRLLLSYGADPLLATYSGYTPLSLAADDEARRLLQQHLSDVQGQPAPPWTFQGAASCCGTYESSILFSQYYSDTSCLELEITVKIVFGCQVIASCNFLTINKVTFFKVLFPCITSRLYCVLPVS
jgi:hypothetical protein